MKIQYPPLFWALPFLALMSCASSLTPEENQKKPLVPVVYDKGYNLSVLGLEKLHPFDIGKYRKINKALRKEGLIDASNRYGPDKLSVDDLKLVHSDAYLTALKSPAAVAGFLEAPSVRLVPKWLLQSKVVKPFILASGGTLKAGRLALKHQLAINLGGGFHHAKPHSGEGFCIIADVPIAIRKLQQEGLIKRALVIDTDIHQGNGTILCLAGDRSTYTFSIHEGGIYPIPKEAGDRDVEVAAQVTDEDYMKTLEKWLPRVIEESKPDIVFHVAGCDALAGDPLANGRMSHAGIVQRDALIVAVCRERKIPYVMTLSGGYSKEAWRAQYASVRNIILARTDDQ